MNRAKIAILLMACLLPVTAAATDPDHTDFTLVDSELGLTAHEEMFVLPVTWADEYKGSQIEVIYQLSAKHDILATRLYFAYTQISFWQAYDQANSAPFRETNYNPEVFYRFRDRPFRGGYLGMDLGFEHESNGRRVPRSRSWNVVHATPWFRTDDWLVHLKIRHRIPEDDKETPDSAVGDDNPGITDFLGYSDLTVVRRFGGGQQLRFLMRGYLGNDLGLFALTWSVVLPGTGGSTFGCLRVSHGFGESMLDYDRRITRVGLGVMFNR